MLQHRDNSFNTENITHKHVNRNSFNTEDNMLTETYNSNVYEHYSRKKQQKQSAKLLISQTPVNNNKQLIFVCNTYQQVFFFQFFFLLQICFSLLHPVMFLDPYSNVQYFRPKDQDICTQTFFTVYMMTLCQKVCIKTGELHTL